VGKLTPRVVGLAQPVEPHAAQHRLGLAELDLAVVDDLDEVAPGVVEAESAARADLDAGLLSARRTAALSSTTRPKWRCASGGCVRPSEIVTNWSPMSMKAMRGPRPRSSKSNRRP
jgi:hypothetical protein